MGAAPPKKTLLYEDESHTEALHTGWLIHGMSKVYFLGAFTYPEKKKKKKNSDVLIIKLRVSYGEGRV